MDEKFNRIPVSVILPVIREFYTREENVQAFEAWLKDRESDPQKHSKRK